MNDYEGNGRESYDDNDRLTESVNKMDLKERVKQYSDSLEVSFRRLNEDIVILD